MSKYTESSAYISECEQYRYNLTRAWGGGNGVAAFIGLNPSTADASEDDPTIRRCVAFAKSWGCSRLLMLNLFAYRATNPADMKRADDPIGEYNYGQLRSIAVCSDARHIVAAWGAHGNFMGQADKVRLMIPQLSYLRLTKDGHPGHPLYLPGSLTPIKWGAP